MHSRNRLNADAYVTPDMVDKPPHYKTSTIECIDAMTAMAEDCYIPSHEAYCWQNCFKYLWRWPYKNGLEDLKKARWYLDRLIKKVEENQHDFKG
jgi:hypothetical protein